MIQKVKKISNTKLEKKYFHDLGELNEMDEINSESVSLIVTSNKAIFRFNFNIESDPFCCGLYSIGEFRIISDTKLIPDSEKISLIKNGFEKLAQISKHNNNREYTLFFTLVNNKSCNLIKEALKSQKYYTIVKTFINQNSGSENILYVSN